MLLYRCVDCITAMLTSICTVLTSALMMLGHGGG